MRCAASQKEVGRLSEALRREELRAVTRKAELEEARRQVVEAETSSQDNSRLLSQAQSKLQIAEYAAKSKSLERHQLLLRLPPWTCEVEKGRLPY